MASLYHVATAEYPQLRLPYAGRFLRQAGYDLPRAEFENLEDAQRCAALLAEYQRRLGWFVFNSLTLEKV